MLAQSTLEALLVTALFAAAAESAGPTRELAPASPRVALQPLAQQVRLVERALSYLGQPLAPEDHERINRATA